MKMNMKTLVKAVAIFAGLEQARAACRKFFNVATSQTPVYQMCGNYYGGKVYNCKRCRTAAAQQLVAAAGEPAPQGRSPPGSPKGPTANPPAALSLIRIRSRSAKPDALRLIRVTFPSESFKDEAEEDKYMFEETNRDVDHNGSTLVDLEVKNVPKVASFAGLKPGDIIRRLLNGTEATKARKLLHSDSDNPQTPSQIRNQFDSAFAEAQAAFEAQKDLQSPKSSWAKLTAFMRAEDLQCIYKPKEDESEIFLLVERDNLEGLGCYPARDTSPCGFFFINMLKQALNLPFFFFPRVFYLGFEQLRLFGTVVSIILVVALLLLAVWGYLFKPAGNPLFFSDDGTPAIGDVDYLLGDPTDKKQESCWPLYTKGDIAAKTTEKMVLLAAVILALSFTVANLAVKFEKAGLTGECTNMTYGVAMTVLIGMGCKGFRAYLTFGLPWFGDQICFFMLEEITLVGTTFLCTKALAKLEFTFRPKFWYHAWGYFGVFLIVALLKCGLVWAVFLLYKLIVNTEAKTLPTGSWQVSKMNKTVAVIFFFGLHLSCDIAQEYVTSISTETGHKEFMTSASAYYVGGGRVGSVSHCVTSCFDFILQECFVIPMLEFDVCRATEMPVKRAVARDVAVQMLRNLY